MWSCMHTENWSPLPEPKGNEKFTSSEFSYSGPKYSHSLHFSQDILVFGWITCIALFKPEKSHKSNPVLEKLLHNIFNLVNAFSKELKKKKKFIWASFFLQEEVFSQKPPEMSSRLRVPWSRNPWKMLKSVQCLMSSWFSWVDVASTLTTAQFLFIFMMPRNKSYECSLLHEIQ